MEHFAILMEKTKEIFQIDFTIYGYTFSMWEVFLYSTIAGIVCWAIGRYFAD